MDNVKMKKYTVKYKYSKLCDPSDYSKIDFKSLGIEVLKVSVDTKNGIVIFDIKSSMAARTELANLARKMDIGWNKEVDRLESVLEKLINKTASISYGY